MRVKSIEYWMILPVLIGIGLFISAFMMGYKEIMKVATNTIVPWWSAWG
jgi:hypothetical protein